ncbi:MAG: Ig-like domain-containing protein, partial [Longimicrobiales bacterium]
PPLLELRRDVPPHMQRAIDGALRKDREQRWRDAAHFLAALKPATSSGRIAPPAMTRRPRGAGEQSQVLDDSPTIVYRPQDDPHIAGGTAARTPMPWDDDTRKSTPVVRFLFDGDDTAEDGPAAVAATATRVRKNGRVPLLVALALLLTLAAVMAPFISADGDRSSESSALAAWPSAAAAIEPLPAATGVYGAPAQLVVLTDQQTGYVGEPLPVPVGLVVKDADDRPVPGAAVELEVITGGGHVAADVAVTDSGGLAMSHWTLGELAGVNELNARVRGMPETTVVIRATGVAGRAARVVAVTGADQTAPRGSTLPEPVAVRVEDANGNPVGGARIEFSIASGGGATQPAIAITDTAGLARASWTIGSVETNTLRATLAESELHVDFSARAEYR